MEKLPYNLSLGLWCLKDNKKIIDKQKKIIEKIKIIGESQLFNGIELHYPYEVTMENFDNVRNTASEYGLKIVSNGLKVLKKDEEILSGLNIYNGKIIYKKVTEDLGMMDKFAVFN